MTKIIRMTLDPASIQAAIRELNDYKKWVIEKTQQLQRRCAELIRDSAAPVFQSALADDVFRVRNDDGKMESASPIVGGVSVDIKDEGNVTIVFTTGKDAVFIEFGAGVHYNGSAGSSPNPLGADLAYTIGGYGAGRGKQDAWYFKSADGNVYETHGTPASMPLYKAVKAVSDDIVRIAKEVFST